MILFKKKLSYIFSSIVIQSLFSSFFLLKIYGRDVDFTLIVWIKYLFVLFLFTNHLTYLISIPATILFISFDSKKTAFFFIALCLIYIFAVYKMGVTKNEEQYYYVIPICFLFGFILQKYIIQLKR